MSLLLIESKTKKYAEIYEELSASITKMENEVEAVKNNHLPGIKSLVAKFKVAAEDLHTNLVDYKHLFVKPKTQIFHNIRVGLSKGKGRKEFDNDETIKLIRKWFPRKQNQLIKVEEKIISTALDKLSVTDLKKIGVEIKDSGDEIVIRPVDSEIRKIVDKIISEINPKEEG